MADIPWYEAGPPAPAGLRLRAATWDDLDAVATLCTASAPTPGSPRTRPDDLRAQWLGYRDLTDILLLEVVETAQPTPAVVAYAAVEVDDDPWTGEVAVHVEGAVHPAWTSQGIGSFLLHRARTRAGAAANQAGRREATLRTSLVDGDERARTWFASRGFHEVRHLLDFRLDLHAPPPAPIWRNGVHARPFVTGQDEQLLWRTHQTAFADVPTHLPLDLEDFLADRISSDTGHRDCGAPGPDRPERGRFDPGLVLIAEHGVGDTAEPVGLAICRAGTPIAPHDGWVRDLGVVPSWRRHGIGMALLRTAFAAFRSRGLTGVALEVDDVTLDGAAALYRRAGMRTVRRTDVLECRLPTEVEADW